MKKIALIWLAVPMLAHAELIPFSKAQMQALGVNVVPMSAASPVMSNHLPGEIVVPVGQERVVSAPLGGLIDALYVAAGQPVKRGQALAHVSSPDLVALQRDYLQARTQQQLAENLLKRDNELFKEGIIAERRMLTTQSGHKELAFVTAQRRQALKLAGMGEASIQRLENSGELVSGITLSAPIDGMVLEQMATSGQRVDISAPVYRIGRLSPLWLEIHAPLDSLHFVRQGMRVNIPKYQAEGRVTTIIRSVNKNDQTMHIRAEITRGVEKLSPGQFVEAELASETMAQQFSIPKTALVRNAQKSYVFVQMAQGFEALPVDVVSEQADNVVVSGRFKGGEKVVMNGTAAIKAAWNGIGGE